MRKNLKYIVFVLFLIGHVSKRISHNTLTFQQLIDIYGIDKQQNIQLRHSLMTKIGISSTHLEHYHYWTASRKL